MLGYVLVFTQVMKSLPTVGIVMMVGDTWSHTQSAKATLLIMETGITAALVLHVHLGLLYSPATLPLTPSAKTEGKKKRDLGINYRHI